MNNLCFNRFTLRTDDAKTRRKILRWLALNYRLYEYLPSEAEIRGRFISRKPIIVVLILNHHISYADPSSKIAAVSDTSRQRLVFVAYGGYSALAVRAFRAV